MNSNHADADLPWLVTQRDEGFTTVELVFGESPTTSDANLLDRIAKARVWAVVGRETEPRPLLLEKDGARLVARLPAEESAEPVVLRHRYGVVTRAEESILLEYYAKAYASALPSTWTTIDDMERLPLEIVPMQTGSTVSMEVRWQGKPAGGVDISVDGPGLLKTLKGTTDANGVFRCQLAEAGLYGVGARLLETVSGQHEGKPYSSVLRYSTLTFRYVPPRLFSVPHSWPNLPRGVTSFGAAVIGDSLYVYGGHYGQPHHYSREGQSGELLRLNLQNPGEWETLAGGPKLTGLAMVAWRGRLYRVGGFTANNGETEDENLRSQPDFARFEPSTNTWEPLPPLPEGRSSHDAAVLANTLYVVGGWQLRGANDIRWHETAWSVDLSESSLEWRPIAPPPFYRRALALAAWRDKLYVLGGMQQQGGPTTDVAVFNPATREWSDGPSLLGTAMDGFGCTAFACGGNLFATTMSGAVQQLSPDGTRWEYSGQLAHPRFFHRMLPWSSNELVIVGGADMSVGKIDTLERVRVGDSREPGN